MTSALTDPTALTALTYLWFGVFDHRGRLVAVEEGELVAMEIANRLGGAHHVKPIYVEPVT